MTNDNPKTAKTPRESYRGDLDRDETGKPTSDESSGSDEGCGCSGESSMNKQSAGPAGQRQGRNDGSQPEDPTEDARGPGSSGERDKTMDAREPGSNRPGNQQGDRKADQKRPGQQQEQNL